MLVGMSVVDSTDGEAGVLILTVPRALNDIVAVNLILDGIISLLQN